MKLATRETSTLESLAGVTRRIMVHRCLVLELASVVVVGSELLKLYAFLDVRVNVK